MRLTRTGVFHCIVRMKKNLTVALIAGLLCGGMAGCQTTPEGTTRAGIPFVKDSFESRYQRPVPAIFEAAKEVLAHNGTLTGENTISNTLTAQIDTRRVVVSVDEVEPGVSRVIIEARTKASLPDLDLAAELDKQIALRLR